MCDVCAVCGKCERLCDIVYVNKTGNEVTLVHLPGSNRGCVHLGDGHS